MKNSLGIRNLDDFDDEEDVNENSPSTLGIRYFDEDEDDTNLDQHEDVTNSLQNGQLTTQNQGEDGDLATEKEEPSFWQSVASHPATQALLGAAKRYTYPADILKMGMLGEGLSDLDELEEIFTREGKPFDRDAYINAIFEASNSIPTQQLLEDKVKEHTGIDLAPKDTFSKIVRQGSEIATTGPKANLAGKPIKEVAKHVAKKGAGGLGGAALGEGAKELGVPEPLADFLASAIGGSAGGKKEPFKLTGKEAKNAQVAEKHALRKFGGLQREKPLEKAIVPTEKNILNPDTLKTAQKELDLSSKKAIDEIVNSKIPATKLQKMGVNLEKAYTKVYDITKDQAKKSDKLGKTFDIDPLLDNIKTRIKDIKKTAPSLSPSDKAEIKELTKQYKQLTTQPANSVKRQAKKVTGEQLLDQYRNFNEETRGIYRKTEFSGSEEVVKNAYAQLKNDLIDVIEKTDPALAANLKTANKLYHESSKLDMVNEIVDKAFENGYNPKKLNQLLGSKRNRAFIDRDLGKGTTKEMQEIAKYGMEAEKVLKSVKNPKTIGEIMSELTPLKASLLFAKGTAGIPVVALYDIPKAAVNRIKGRLMLSPKTRQSYSDFVRHAVSPESAAFKKASQQLTKSIEDEYGSEKDFLKFLEEDESDTDNED